MSIQNIPVDKTLIMSLSLKTVSNHSTTLLTERYASIFSTCWKMKSLTADLLIGAGPRPTGVLRGNMGPQFSRKKCCASFSYRFL